MVPRLAPAWNGSGAQSNARSGQGSDSCRSAHRVCAVGASRQARSMATLMTWSRSKPSPVVSQSTWSASCGWTVRGVRSSSFAPRVVGVHREGRGVRRRRMSCSCRRRPPVSVFSLPRFLTPARRRFSLAPQEAVCGRRRRGAALTRKARVVGWRCGARAPAGRGHGERLDGESGFVKSGGVRRCGTWRQSSPPRRPSSVRVAISERSNSAMRPNTVSTMRPAGVVVSAQGAPSPG